MISSSPGFIPLPNAMFTLLNASLISGQFAQVQKNGFDPGLGLDVLYGTTTVNVRAVRVFPLGDADHDGNVDHNDYALWKSTFGSTVDLRADFNGNGIIDAADYTLWRDNLQQAPSELIGDYNRNGVVDAADYTVYRDTLGSTIDLRADGSRNGIVDPADYDLWKSHFGQTFPPGAGGGASASGEAQGAKALPIVVTETNTANVRTTVDTHLTTFRLSPSAIPLHSAFDSWYWPVAPHTADGTRRDSATTLLAIRNRTK